MQQSSLSPRPLKAPQILTTYLKSQWPNDSEFINTQKNPPLLLEETQRAIIGKAVIECLVDTGDAAVNKTVSLPAKPYSLIGKRDN